MFRNNLALEILGVFLVIAAGLATFFILPLSWFIAAPIAVFASYVVLETVAPKVWETPPKGIRYDPEDDE